MVHPSQLYHGGRYDYVKCFEVLSPSETNSNGIRECRCYKGFVCKKHQAHIVKNGTGICLLGLQCLYNFAINVDCDLKVYGGLKSAIQELSNQYEKMKMQVNLLQTQRFK